MTKIAFISGADSRYMPLLEELIASVKAALNTQHDLSYETTFGVIDAGLNDDQRQKLEAYGIQVADGIWPAPEAEKRAGGKQFLRACVSRPFIPQLFPDHDIYIWLDADTWVQDYFAIDWLIKAAQKTGFAATPQVDRNWGKSMRLKWLGPLPFKARSFYYSNARAAFGHKTARALFPYPTVNAGVFAMRGNAPHWQRWQTLIRQALKKGKVFTAEQLTMGIMIWLEHCDVEFLPATCNWLCENKPFWDATAQGFVEPSIPHHPIGIMHLSGYDEMRLDPAIMTEIKTVEGQPLHMSLRYQGITSMDARTNQPRAAQTR